MRAAFQKKRKRFGAVTRVENRHSRRERDFRGVRAKCFPFELDRTKNLVVDYAELQIRVFQDIERGRSFRFFSGTIGQRQQTIVFVKRECDVPRSGWKRVRSQLRERRPCKNDAYSEEQKMTVHLPPAFLSC